MGADAGLPRQDALTVRPAYGLAIVGLGASLAPLDIAVNIALPAITAHFALALGEVQWLVICYVLVYGALMLVCGKLGDLIGHRRVFRAGLAISAVGCAACAMAPDWPLFLAARAVQGVGTALALSCAPALAISLYDESRRTGALAAFTAAQAIAAAAGPLLGGIVVAVWSWQGVYWVRVPIALVALVLSGALPSPRPESRPFDLRGAALLAAATSALLMALVLGQRPATPPGLAAALAAGALAGLVLFVHHAARTAEPILQPALFADPAFTVPNALNVLANLSAFAILLLTPYYLLDVAGLDASAGGLVLALAFVGAMAGAALAARLAPIFGLRPLAFLGIAVQAGALLALGFGGTALPLAAVALVLATLGAGQGLLNVAYTDIVTGAMARRDRGLAGSLALLTRTFGIVGGASVLTALQAYGAAGLPPGPDAFLAGYRFALTVAGGSLLAALLVSCLWWRAWFAR